MCLRRFALPSRRTKLQLEPQADRLRYRQNSELSHAAIEYDRTASQSHDPALRSEALARCGRPLRAIQFRDRALDAYKHYV